MRNRWVLLLVVTAVVVGLLWFKGGEFFCRVRGGIWSSPGEFCVSP